MTDVTEPIVGLVGAFLAGAGLGSDNAWLSILGAVVLGMHAIERLLERRRSLVAHDE